MAEESKTNGTQAKSSTSKPAETKVNAASKSKAATKATEPEGNEQALSLSVQQRFPLPQNRPIQPSNLQVVHTYSSVGSNRPVSKGTMEFNTSLAISGNRPIAASTLQVSDTYIMGNRPIASNESDETASLMGYLD